MSTAIQVINLQVAFLNIIFILIKRLKGHDAGIMDARSFNLKQINADRDIRIEPDAWR